MITLVNEVLLIALIVVLGVALGLMETMQRRHQKEREQWTAERKDLLDRIQAPSFQEYANKVIREKKAEKPEEKVDQVEFIS